MANPTGEQWAGLVIGEYDSQKAENPDQDPRVSDTTLFMGDGDGFESLTAQGYALNSGFRMVGKVPTQATFIDKLPKPADERQL